MQPATKFRDSTSPDDLWMVSKEVHMNCMEAKAVEQAESMAGISEVLGEFDSKASALANDVNELVSNFRPLKDCMGFGMQVGIQFPEEDCRAEYSKRKHDIVNVVPISKYIYTGMRRVYPPNESGDISDTIPRKAKFGGSRGKHEALKEHEHMSLSERGRAVHNVWSQFCPLALTKDGDADEFRKEAHDGTTAVVNEDEKMIDIREGKTQRARIYPRRPSKDGVVSQANVGASSPEVKQEKGGRNGKLEGSHYRITTRMTECGHRELNVDCVLCIGKRGVQSFCQRCRISLPAHRSCFLKVSTMLARGFDWEQHCDNCNEKVWFEDIKKAEDDVKLAEKDIKVKEEARKKAVEDVKVARKVYAMKKKEASNVQRARSISSTDEYLWSNIWYNTGESRRVMLNGVAGRVLLKDSRKDLLKAAEKFHSFK